MITTILVVEADPLVRTPLAGYLRDCGYAVYEAFDGTEAMRIMTSGKREIHAVLCAVSLGSEPNGFAVAKWIRTHHPQTKVLLAGTPEKAASTAAELCDGGGSDLARPYDPQLVVERIRKMRGPGLPPTDTGDDTKASGL
jgi:DNA-binding response OmpR family regulator